MGSLFCSGVSYIKFGQPYHGFRGLLQGLGVAYRGNTKA